MKRVNALELRQSLGKVVANLEKTGEPVLLERGRRPAAVLITLRDFQERFVEKSASEERAAVIREIDALARPSKDRTPIVEILRRQRQDG